MATRDLDTVHFDAVIVGGGMAGSVCAAMLAQRGWRIALIEKCRFDLPRIGEVCSPRLLEELRSACGIDLLADASPNGRISSPIETGIAFQVCWGESGDHLPGATSAAATHIRVDRRWIDHRLFEHARQCGVHTYCSARISHAQRNAETWLFRIHSEQTTIHATARLAIEATGRTVYSPFPTARGRVFNDSTIAFACRIPDDTSPLPNKVVNLETDSNGWWYSSRLPSGERLVVYFTDRDLLPHKRSLRSEWLKRSVAQTQFISTLVEHHFSGSHIEVWSRHDARMSIRRQCSGIGWITIGDAQMALDPLSGQGMLESVRSAQLCMPVVVNALTDRQSRIDHSRLARQTAARYNQHLMQCQLHYDSERSWSGQLYWQRRHRGGQWHRSEKDLNDPHDEFTTVAHSH